MSKTLVYTADGHPTAVRLSRLRKKFGAKFHNRNPAFWFPGSPGKPAKRPGLPEIPARPPEIEQCGMIAVESSDSPIAKAYLEAGFVLDLRKNRKDDTLKGKPTVRVLRKRNVSLPPSIIDIDAEDKANAEVTERMSQNRPISKEGQDKVKAAKDARANRKGLNNKNKSK